MCRSVREAQGDPNRRCPVHRPDSIIAIHTVAKETGLSKPVVEELFNELRKEGRGLRGASLGLDSYTDVMSDLATRFEATQPTRRYLDVQSEASRLSPPKPDTLYALRRLNGAASERDTAMTSFFETVSSATNQSITTVRRNFESLRARVEAEGAEANTEHWTSTAERTAFNANLPNDRYSVIAMSMLPNEVHTGPAAITRESLSHRGSGVIAEGGYDPDSGRMEIVFAQSDTVYSYQNVPQEHWDEIRSDSPAPMRYFNQHIRGNTAYLYATESVAATAANTIQCDDCGQFASSNSGHICPDRVLGEVITDSHIDDYGVDVDLIREEVADRVAAEPSTPLREIVEEVVDVAVEAATPVPIDTATPVHLESTPSPNLTEEEFLDNARTISSTPNSYARTIHDPNAYAREIARDLSPDSDPTEEQIRLVEAAINGTTERQAAALDGFYLETHNEDGTLRVEIFDGVASRPDFNMDDRGVISTQHRRALSGPVLPGLYYPPESSRFSESRRLEGSQIIGKPEEFLAHGSRLHLQYLEGLSQQHKEFMRDPANKDKSVCVTLLSTFDDNGVRRSSRSVITYVTAPVEIQSPDGQFRIAANLSRYARRATIESVATGGDYRQSTEGLGAHRTALSELIGTYHNENLPLTATATRFAMNEYLPAGSIPSESLAPLSAEFPSARVRTPSLNAIRREAQASDDGTVIIPINHDFGNTSGRGWHPQSVYIDGMEITSPYRSRLVSAGGYVKLRRNEDGTFSEVEGFNRAIRCDCEAYRANYRCQHSRLFDISASHQVLGRLNAQRASGTPSARVPLDPAVNPFPASIMNLRRVSVTPATESSPIPVASWRLPAPNVEDDRSTIRAGVSGLNSAVSDCHPDLDPDEQVLAQTVLNRTGFPMPRRNQFRSVVRNNGVNEITVSVTPRLSEHRLGGARTSLIAESLGMGVSELRSGHTRLDGVVSFPSDGNGGVTVNAEALRCTCGRFVAREGTCEHTVAAIAYYTTVANSFMESSNPQEADEERITQLTLTADGARRLAVERIYASSPRISETLTAETYETAYDEALHVLATGEPSSRFSSEVNAELASLRTAQEGLQPLTSNVRRRIEDLTEGADSAEGSAANAPPSIDRYMAVATSGVADPELPDSVNDELLLVSRSAELLSTPPDQRDLVELANVSDAVRQQARRTELDSITNRGSGTSLSAARQKKEDFLAHRPTFARNLEGYRTHQAARFAEVDANVNPVSPDDVIRAVGNRSGDLGITPQTSNVTDGICDPSVPGSRRFGVELEFNIDRNYGGEYLDVGERTNRIIQEMRAEGLTSQNRIGGYHQSQRSGWTEWSVESDSTVDIEIVSPIMGDSPEEWEKFSKVLEIIKRNGGNADSANCGSHVSISSSSLIGSLPAYAELTRNVKDHEDELYRAAGNPVRRAHRGGSYCLPNSVTPSSPIAPHSPPHHSLQRARKAINMVSNLDSPSERDRVEFRLWDGSLDLATIQTQIATSAALVDRSDYDTATSDISMPRTSKSEKGTAYQRIHASGERGSGSVDDPAAENVSAFVNKFFRRDLDKQNFLKLFSHNRWNA